MRNLKKIDTLITALIIITFFGTLCNLLETHADYAAGAEIIHSISVVCSFLSFILVMVASDKMDKVFSSVKRRKKKASISKAA